MFGSLEPYPNSIEIPLGVWRLRMKSRDTEMNKNAWKSCSLEGFSLVKRLSGGRTGLYGVRSNPC